MGKRTSSSIGNFEPAFDSEMDNGYETVTYTDFQMQPDGNWESTTEHIHMAKPQDYSQQDEGESKDLDLEEARRIFLMDEAEIGELLPADPSDVSHPVPPKSHTEKDEKRSSDTPLLKWISSGCRETFLLELLRLEGRGDKTDGRCYACESDGALYRCTSCTGLQMSCQACIVSAHLCNPLHIIEKWHDNSHFERISLRDLGLVVQLGHPWTENCKNPRRAHKDGFTVIDIYGIHTVELNFCNCERATMDYVRILRHGWYPASTERPKTAATQNVLKFFHLSSFESKTSLYEFFNTLKRFFDNTGTKSLKDKSAVLAVMVRQWRNLKGLKRGARGHKNGGAAETAPGELAVLCAACPHPGINMSPQWKRAPAEKQFLHTLFLAIDGNFRLKRRHSSSEEKDPSISDGCSYFVPYAQYMSHLLTYDSRICQPKKSTCNNHKAISAERSDPSFAVSGVVSVDCARHDMKRPLGVGDLLNGERYVNTDFIFFKSLQWSQIRRVVASYDICCQWNGHIWERMSIYPRELWISDDKRKAIQFLVPKFHLPSHVEACQTQYSFNFAEGVGRTDGEAPERGWSNTNPVAASTMEMGPGSRRDTLDDHFGDLNWKKTVNLGTLLLKRINEAAQEANDYRFLHHQFVLGLSKRDVQAWTKQLSGWLKDKSKPNPFAKRFPSISEKTIRKRLIEQEQAAAKKGERVFSLHKTVTAANLIILGLYIEEEQLRIAGKLANGDSTKGKNSLGGEIHALEYMLEKWIEIQHLYVPALDGVRKRDAVSLCGKEQPPFQNAKLYLPSSMQSLDEHLLCDVRLLNIEYDLRQGQANDALNDLRSALRLRTYAYTDKDRFQRGQRRNTRSRGIISRIEEKVSAAAEKYRVARHALIQLAPALQRKDCDTKFPPLNRDDIRGYADDDLPAYMKVKLTTKQKKQLLKQTSKWARKKNRQSLSWIWKRSGAHSSILRKDPILEEDLRIEFCKSKARADRWREEVLLLQEEMRRVLRFFLYRKSSWLSIAQDVSRQSPTEEVDAPTLEGMRAYASQQASMFDAMYERCCEQWESVPLYSEGRDGTVVATDSTIVREFRLKEA